MDVRGIVSFSVTKGMNVYTYTVPMGSSYDDAIDVLLELANGVKEVRDREKAAQQVASQQAAQQESAKTDEAQ